MIVLILKEKDIVYYSCLYHVLHVVLLSFHFSYHTNIVASNTIRCLARMQGKGLFTCDYSKNHKNFPHFGIFYHVLYIIQS